MRTTLIVITLVLCLFSLNAQIAECGLGQEDFKEFLNGKVHVVVLEDNERYNEKMASYMQEHWTVNDFDFVEEKVFLDKGYLKDHKEEYYIYPVALMDKKSATSNDVVRITGSYNIGIKEREDGATAIALFKAKELTKAVAGGKYIHVDEKFTLAYFSFLRKYRLKHFQHVKKAFVKGLDISPMDERVDLAMIYIQKLIENRNRVTVKKLMACNTFLKKMSELMNDPGILKNKTILISDLYLNEISEEDIAKELDCKFEIVSPARLAELVDKRNPEYAVLTSCATGRGYIVSVLDLRSGNLVYHDFYINAGQLKKKHLSQLNKLVAKARG